MDLPRRGNRSLPTPARTGSARLRAGSVVRQTPREFGPAPRQAGPKSFAAVG
jgi:hypothetical protein